LKLGWPHHPGLYIFRHLYAVNGPTACDYGAEQPPRTNGALAEWAQPACGTPLLVKERSAFLCKLVFAIQQLEGTPTAVSYNELLTFVQPLGGELRVLPSAGRSGALGQAVCSAVVKPSN
jgi:hypothetical protein